MNIKELEFLQEQNDQLAQENKLLREDNAQLRKLLQRMVQCAKLAEKSLEA